MYWKIFKNSHSLFMVAIMTMPYCFWRILYRSWKCWPFGTHYNIFWKAKASMLLLCNQLNLCKQELGSKMINEHKFHFIFFLLVTKCSATIFYTWLNRGETFLFPIILLTLRMQSLHWISSLAGSWVVMGQTSPPVAETKQHNWVQFEGIWLPPSSSRLICFTLTLGPHVLPVLLGARYHPSLISLRWGTTLTLVTFVRNTLHLHQAGTCTPRAESTHICLWYLGFWHRLMTHFWKLQQAIPKRNYWSWYHI